MNYGQKLDVVLGVGGQKGFEHLGVLRALEEFGVSLGDIIGGSVGSIVATMYCNGYSVDQIEKAFFDGVQNRYSPALFMRMMTSPDWKNWATGGLMPDILPPLQDMCKQFGLTSKPDLKIWAFDLESRKPVLFEGDFDPAVAMAASCAMPGAFRPVNYNGMRLVDGGIYHRNPDEFCTRPAIISCIGLATELPTEMITPMEFAWHLREMCLAPGRNDVNEDRNIVITVDVPDVSGLSFSRSPATNRHMMEVGKQTARAELYRGCAEGKLPLPHGKCRPAAHLRA